MHSIQSGSGRAPTQNEYIYIFISAKSQLAFGGLDYDADFELDFIEEGVQGRLVTNLVTNLSPNLVTNSVNRQIR